MDKRTKAQKPDRYQPLHRARQVRTVVSVSGHRPFTASVRFVGIYEEGEPQTSLT